MLSRRYFQVQRVWSKFSDSLNLKSVTMTPKRRPILLLPFTFFLFQAVYADQNFTEFDGFHIEVGSVLIRNWLVLYRVCSWSVFDLEPCLSILTAEVIRLYHAGIEFRRINFLLLGRMWFEPCGLWKQNTFCKYLVGKNIEFIRTLPTIVTAHIFCACQGTTTTTTTTTIPLFALYLITHLKKEKNIYIFIFT